MAHRHHYTPYVTPDAALKQSEQLREDGNWNAAIDILNQALQNRRIKSNSSMLERIMVSQLKLIVISCLTRHNFTEHFDRYLRRQ